MYLTTRLLEEEPGKWWGVDFDGTLSKYDEWEGPGNVGDPIAGTIAIVKKMLRNGHKLKIFTARVADAAQRDEAVAAIEAFCQKHIGQKLPVTNEKDPGMVGLIDDKLQMIRVKQNAGTVLMKSTDIIESLLEGEDFDNVPKPDDLKGLMREVSLGKDKDGYFVYTHRCRSDSYKSPHKIPKSRIEFVSSTS